MTPAHAHGRPLRKVNFDARKDPTPKNEDLYLNPWRYSFIHNFKVHYKASVLQTLANKIDISISSSSAELPPTQRVLDEFNQRMQLGNVGKNDRVRKSAISYHVTDIEYKESIALHDPRASQTVPLPQPPMLVGGSSAGQLEFRLFCNKCGWKLPDGSRFCNSCGAPVVGA